MYRRYEPVSRTLHSAFVACAVTMTAVTLLFIEMLVSGHVAHVTLAALSTVVHL